MRKDERAPTDFGRFVLAKMAEHDLSQSSLAVQAKVSQSTVSRWIYSPGKPDPELLHRLAQVIEVSHGELMAIAGHGRPADNTDRLTVAPTLLHPLAAELDRMLADSSPIGEEDRAALETIVDRVIAPYRRVMKRRRSG